MSSKSIGLLVVAVLCGLVASVTAVRYVRARGASAPAGGVPVVVAAAALPAGTVLDEKALRVIHVPREAVPEGAFQDPKALVGMAVRYPIAQNAPVLKSSVSGSDRILQAMVAPGMRACSVVLEPDAAALAAHLRPGDRVDVIWIRRGPDEGAEPQARLLMQDVRVLAIGQPSDGATSSKDKKATSSLRRPGAEGETVTLEVTPEQFLLLGALAEEGKIKLALRRPGETGKADLPQVDLRRLLEPEEPKDSQPPPQVSPPIAMTPIDEYIIEIIMGTTIEHQTYQRVAGAPLPGTTSKEGARSVAKPGGPRGQEQKGAAEPARVLARPKTK